MNQSNSIHLREEAVEDLQNSYEYYEEQQIGLGEYFLEWVQDTLHGIAKHPKASPIVYKNYRQAVVSKFPFVVLLKLARG